MLQLLPHAHGVGAAPMGPRACLVSRLGSFEPGDKTWLRLSPHLAPSAPTSHDRTVPHDSRTDNTIRHVRHVCAHPHGVTAIGRFAVLTCCPCGISLGLKYKTTSQERERALTRSSRSEPVVLEHAHVTHGDTGAVPLTTRPTRDLTRCGVSGSRSLAHTLSQSSLGCAHRMPLTVVPPASLPMQQKCTARSLAGQLTSWGRA